MTIVTDILFKRFKRAINGTIPESSEVFHGGQKFLSPDVLVNEVNVLSCLRSVNRILKT